MKYLLDVNVLIAAVLKNHSQHSIAANWIAGKQLVVSPLCELGFLRISTNKRIMDIEMEEARESLSRFLVDRNIEWIPDDIHGLDSIATAAQQVMDNYLADLAAKHGMKLATLDRKITHSNVEVVGKVE